MPQIMLMVKSEKFPMGQLVMTPGACELMVESSLAVTKALARHSVGDWGELDADDKQENEMSLRNGFRLLSAYSIPVDGESKKLWIITEADRSVTTLLLPSEY